MSTYQEYHYHSLPKLIVMTFLSVGTYAFYYWYRLWRGQYHQPTAHDRRKSFTAAMLFYVSVHGLLVALSERLKNTDNKLALTGYKSPTMMTILIAGTTLLFAALVTWLTLTAPGSRTLLDVWLAFAAVTAFFMVSLQININRAYLLEHHKKPAMPTKGYIWYGLFAILFLLQDAAFLIAPSESKYQNVDTDYSGKLPKELLDF